MQFNSSFEFANQKIRIPLQGILYMYDICDISENHNGKGLNQAQTGESRPAMILCNSSEMIAYHLARNHHKNSFGIIANNNCFKPLFTALETLN